MEQHQAPRYPTRSIRAASLENKEINHYVHITYLQAAKENLGVVWEALKKYPVGIIAKRFDGNSGWSGRIVHYLLCRQLKVEKKEIWSVVGDQPIRFSLLEFGEITGLNTDPEPTESFQLSAEVSDKYREFWEELKVPHGLGPTPDELMAALSCCRGWSPKKREWLGLLVLLAMGIYGEHHNSRIPFETAKRVFNENAMMNYPWGRAAFEALVGSIQSLNPAGNSYHIKGMSYALLAWAFKSVKCFEERFGKEVAGEGEIPLLRWAATRTRASFDSVLQREIKEHKYVRVRHMVMKESVEDMFPQWPEEDDDRELDNLIRDLHSGTFVRGDYWDVQRKEEKKKPKKKSKLALVPYDSEPEPPKKKQKKDNWENEGEAGEENEAADIEKKEDAKGKGLSQDAATLDTIVATLGKIVDRFDFHESFFDKLGSKFESIDSKFGELTRKFGDVEKEIGDYVKDAVDERLKVLGISESGHNYVPSPKTQTLPRHNTQSQTLDKAKESQTPQQYFPKSKAEIPKGTPDELGIAEDGGSKLKAEIHKGTPEAKKNFFGSGLPDFVGVSPAKEKQIPDQRRVSRRQNPIPIQNAAEFQKRKDDAAKKKADDAAKKKADAAKKKAEAATKRRENATKKKEDKLAAELKGNEENTTAELKNTAAVLKKEVQEKGRLRRVRLPSRVPATPGKKKGKSGAETDLEDVTEEEIAKRNELLPESDEDEDERLRLARIKDRRTNVIHLLLSGLAAEHAIGGWTSGVFPYLFGDRGPTCMRKDVEPSSAIYDPFAPVDTYNLGNFKQHLNTFEDIPLAINEQKDDDRSSEANFYRVLITERPWRNNDDGWLSDDHVAAYIRVLIRRSMEEPTPFCSERIAFVDQWFLGAWMKEYNQFKINPKLFKFEGKGYEKLINGAIPHGLQTKKKWFQDVDHLYGVLNTSGCHWVAFHVDLLKEKIDVYDPIIGDVHPEKEQSRLDAFRPLLEMIPAMINALIPGQKTVGRKPFAFTWKTAKNIPQNTQSGDCGVYSLKFVECLAPGLTFDGICDSNIQGLWVKLAVDIFDEGGYAMLYGQFE